MHPEKNTEIPKTFKFRSPRSSDVELHLFFYPFFFCIREEKNVALSELREELLAGKKNLETLRQQVTLILPIVDY